MFRVGELVIKKNDGNKMRIIEFKDELFTCIYATDKIHTCRLKPEELMKLKDYDSFIITQTRSEKINNIFKD